MTKTELDIIDSLSGTQSRRLLFTLLCVAKYWNAIHDLNNGWVNTSDKDVMRMANIKPSIRRQSSLLHQMRQAGYIQFSKKIDSLNIQIMFIDQYGEPMLHITDFRNLGNQYLRYCGEPYFQCAECGLVIKRNGNAQKYCSDCASGIYIKKTVESVMRQRANFQAKKLFV